MKKKDNFKISNDWFYGILIFMVIAILIFLMLYLMLSVDEKMGTLWLIVTYLNGEQQMFVRQQPYKPTFKADFLEHEDEFYMVYDIEPLPEEVEDYLEFELPDGPLSHDELSQLLNNE
jgi:hypothetical protein